LIEANALPLSQTSVTNVSVHASMPKDDILALNVTREYTNDKI